MWPHAWACLEKQWVQTCTSLLMLNPYFGGLRTKSVLCVPPAHLILVVGGLGVSGLLAWPLPEPLGQLGWREEIGIYCITLKSRVFKFV